MTGQNTNELAFEVRDIQPCKRRIRPGCFFFESGEISKNPNAFKGHEPYIIKINGHKCPINPYSIRDINDLKVGDEVYSDWYDGATFKGVVTEINGEEGWARVSDSLRFTLTWCERRKCWTNSGWVSVNTDAIARVSIDDSIGDNNGT